MSGGDPGVAFGPRPSANGTFSWANGSRLYYSNLTANFPGGAFKGFEAVAVSRAAIGPDIPLMVDLYLSGQLMLDELVSLTRPLDRFSEVVDEMHAGRVARGVLTFD